MRVLHAMLTADHFFLQRLIAFPGTDCPRCSHDGINGLAQCPECGLGLAKA